MVLMLDMILTNSWQQKLPIFLTIPLYWFILHFVLSSDCFCYLNAVVTFDFVQYFLQYLLL